MQKLMVEKINAFMSSKTKKKITDIRLFDAVTSTNDIAMLHAKDHPHQNTVFLAETQTSGRGQFNRPWISPKNNIYCSLTWCFNKKISEIITLSIEIGKALQTGLKKYGVSQKIDIKLPNDLLFENKKLAGILIETFTLDPKHCIAIIGFGMNIDLPENTVGITQPWTTLSAITNSIHDRNHLLGEILNEICKTCCAIDTECDHALCI